MKKILIYEYFTGGGLLNEDLSSDLMLEARMMLSTLIESCDRSKSFDCNYFLDHRLKDLYSDKAIVTHADKDLYDLSLIKEYDYVLPILPETNSNLLSYIKFLEKNNIKKIISNSETIKICSDKLLFYKYLHKYSIPVIPTCDNINSKILPNKCIIKDRYGAGCSYVRVTDKSDLSEHYAKDRVIQPLIKGDSYSLSIFFGKSNYRLLTINRQHTVIEKNMIKLKYLSINVNKILYSKVLSIIAEIHNSLPGLFGFVGIDILLKKNDIYIVEVNTRLTTSYVGVYKTIGCNIIDLLVNHKYIKNVITSREYCLSNNE